MNEKPLRSEAYLRSEEYLGLFPPDSPPSKMPTAPWGNESGLVLEEFEDRIEYVYKVCYIRFWEGGPENERHLLHLESKEEARNRTREQGFEIKKKCFQLGTKIQHEANKIHAANLKVHKAINKARRTLESL
jgi:hypothetical protein